MEEQLAAVTAELNKLKIKYNSAMQTIGSNAATAADQVFDVAADLAIANAKLAELEKRIAELQPAPAVKTDDLD